MPSVPSAPSPSPEPAAADNRRSTTVVGLTVGLVVAAALAVLGTLVMWPRGDDPELTIAPRDYVDATVTDLEHGDCAALDIGRPEQINECVLYSAELTSGPHSGDVVTVTVTVTMTDIPELSVGDQVVLRHNPTATPEYEYSFEDFQRTAPLLWLVVAFVVAVVAFGRWQGLRALAGLGSSLLVLVLFIVPALLQQQPALPVALAGASLVAFIAIYMAHGPNMTSSIALAGTLVSLALTAVGAVVFASLAQLSGLSGEEAQVLNVTVDALDLQGLLVAGIVIGALGVLDDVTISQVSTVAALRRANPGLSSRQLYGEAVRVGRDHVAAAVNTLVLAYAGASLPLLLMFSQSNQPLSRIFTGELVAVSIVRMLVGSIGLILAVPITTGLAAVILARGEPPDDHHGHTHGPVGMAEVTSTVAPAAAAAHELIDEDDDAGARPRHLARATADPPGPPPALPHEPSGQPGPPRPHEASPGPPIGMDGDDTIKPWF